MLRSLFERNVRGRRVRVPSAAAALLMLAATACEAPVDPTVELLLSQASVQFRAVRGSTSPQTQTLTIANSGGGRLGPISCPANPASWLTCQVTGGNLVTLTANPSGLTQTPQTATVELTAPGASSGVQVSVDLLVEAPVLTLASSRLEFTAAESGNTATPSPGVLSFGNTGPGTVASLGAVTCSPSDARVTCSVGTGQLTVTVNPTGLSPGVHVFPVTVASPNTSVTTSFSAVLTVQALPRLTLSRTNVQFPGPGQQAIRGSTTPLSQTVTISNSGVGSLGTLSCPSNPATWLTCSIAGTTLTVTANLAGLTTSPAPVTFNVSASAAVNSPQQLTVGLVLDQPSLALSTNAVSFTLTESLPDVTPASHPVQVSNAGAGALANLGTVTCTAPTGSPVACAYNSQTGQLTVSVNPAGLTAGVTLHQVTVSATNSNITQMLGVFLNVQPKPRIALTQERLRFAAFQGSTTTQTQTLRITNAGGGTLGTVTCTPSAFWVSCAVVGDLLEVTVNPTGFESSPAEAFVTVTAANATSDPRTVAVDLIIQGLMRLSTQQVSFSASTGTGQTVPPGAQTTPASATVTVSNASGGSLASLGTISCSTSDGRVACSVNQLTGEVTITVNAVGLAVGTYNFTTNIFASSASNSPQLVDITLSVTAGGME